MNIDEFAPAGGGSLRARSVVHSGQTVATFTETPLIHDEIWQNSAGLNNEFHTARSGASAAQQEEEKPGQSMGGAFDFPSAARTIRSALRGEP